MTGKWSFNKYLKVSYTWSNAPSGMKSTVPIDSNKYKPGDLVSVDGTMTATTAYKDESAKKYYTFSGWNKSGSFNISSDINISGSWDNGKSVSNESANIYYDNSDDKKYLDYRIVTICYGNGIWVAGGNHILWSNDAVTWNDTGISIPSNSITRIRYGNGLFVGVAYMNYKYWYSSDGKSWDLGQYGLNANYGAYPYSTVCYGNGVWIAAPNIMYCNDPSTDSGNWKELNEAVSFCIFANGKFVGTGGSNKIIYSTNGINWSSTTLSNGTYDTICYGNGKYVIAGWGEHWVAYSEDGINWTSKRYSTKTAQFQGRDAGYICYGNGNFIIVCNTNDDYYYTSTNLVDWTEIDAGWYKSNYSDDACYADGKFIFPSSAGTYISSGPKYNYYFHQIMMYPNDVTYIT